jgi:hypothetical protein
MPIADFRMPIELGTRKPRFNRQSQIGNRKSQMPLPNVQPISPSQSKTARQTSI